MMRHSHKFDCTQVFQCYKLKDGYIYPVVTSIQMQVRSYYVAALINYYHQIIEKLAYFKHLAGVSNLSHVCATDGSKCATSDFQV